MVKVNPIGVGGLEALKNGQSMGGIRQTGSIRRADGFGFIRFGFSLFGSNFYFAGVYQKRVTGYNNQGRIAGRPRRAYYVRMRYYRPTNPNSIAQQAGRTKFAEACAGWATLSDSEKVVYNRRANKMSRRGRNLYISEFMS